MKALSGVRVGICSVFLVVNWKNLWIVQSTCFGQEIRFPHWKRWCEWNTQFKTDVRRFIRGEHGQLSSFATRLCGRYVWPFVDLLTQTHLMSLMNLWNWVSLNCIRSDNLWLFCCSVTIGFVLLRSGVLSWHIRFFFFLLQCSSWKFKFVCGALVAVETCLQMGEELNTLSIMSQHLMASHLQTLWATGISSSSATVTSMLYWGRDPKP